VSDKPHLLERFDVIDKLSDMPWGAPINTPKQVYQEPRVPIPPFEFTGDMTLEEYVERKKK
jgi:hypothetical protein